MKKLYFFIMGCILTLSLFAQQNKSYLLFEPINFSEVKIKDDFWSPKLKKIATTTLQACIYQTETATPRIRNFEIAIGRKEGKFEGRFYDDSDVFKALEAIAYSLNNHPDDTLEKKADEWIDLIALAQEPNGYINTYYTLKEPENKWTDMSMHEDYNGGHLIEAAVAYYNATGKRKLLDVAIRFADHFDSLFGPGKRHWVTGHQELELAMVKLYKITNQEKYLKLADWLLLERGHRKAVGYTWTDWKDTAYAQDIKPVKEQTKITGHAVRAMYLYTGAADVAAITGDKGYMSAMKAVWEDVVHRNMYVTGGIGSSGSNEGFSKDYDLPNERAYAETCASVGMVFWNQRMNLLTGESKYIDVLERSLFNGAMDGLSLSGDRFFYGNPLASSGQHYRREWFGTACCPSNISRLVASVGDYIYGRSATGLWVNLFIGSSTDFTIGKIKVPVMLETGYPWNGQVKLTLNPAARVNFDLRLRIPGWLLGNAVPGNLYSFKNTKEAAYKVLLNGKEVPFVLENGYARISREWKKGDVVQLQMTMEINRLISHPEVTENAGKMALQRGPLVYCIEGNDNNGEAWNLILPENAALTIKEDKVLSESIIAINARIPVIELGEDGQKANTVVKTVRAIPYYTWANRGQNPMRVWIPTKINNLRVN